MISIGVILNPRSRYLRRHPAAMGRLHTLVGQRGLVAESKDLEHVVRVAEDFRAAGIDLVAIAGGDGTAGITIGAFHQVYGDDMPPFAMLRGGTMNTVSNALHLPRGTPEKNLARLIARTENGSAPGTALRPTLRAGPPGQGRVGFLFGTGVFQSFLREYYRRGDDDPSAATAVETIGVMAASALAQGPLIKKLAAPTHLVLDVDGEEHPPDHYMVVAAGTVEQVGLGFTPFYLADRFRGAFHMLALTAGPSKVVRDLPRVWFGLPISPEHGRDLVVRRVTLRSPDGPIDYMIDGDLYTADDTLVIENGPSVRIVM